MIDSKFNALNIHRFDYKKCVILFNHFYSISAGWPNWKDFSSIRRQPEKIREYFVLLFFFLNLFRIYCWCCATYSMGLFNFSKLSTSAWQSTRGQIVAILICGVLIFKRIWLFQIAASFFFTNGFDPTSDWCRMVTSFLWRLNFWWIGSQIIVN